MDSVENIVNSFYKRNEGILTGWNLKLNVSTSDIHFTSLDESVEYHFGLWTSNRTLEGELRDALYWEFWDVGGYIRTSDLLMTAPDNEVIAFIRSCVAAYDDEIEKAMIWTNPTSRA